MEWGAPACRGCPRSRGSRRWEMLLPGGGQLLALPSMLCCADSALRFHGGAARVAGQGTAQGTPEPSCIERVEPEPLAKPLVQVCREGAGGPSWTLVTKTLGALALTLGLLHPLT